MSSDDITAVATSIAAAVAIIGIVLKLRENRLKTRALRVEEHGNWYIISGKLDKEIKAWRDT